MDGREKRAVQSSNKPSSLLSSSGTGKEGYHDPRLGSPVALLLKGRIGGCSSPLFCITGGSG
jgi:hypothetical protein